HRVATLGEQVNAVFLHAPVGAEVKPAFRHRLARIVEQRGSRMFQLRRSPARPGESVILAITRPTFGARGGGVERSPVLLMELQPLGALTAVADGPSAAVDFPQRVLDVRLVVL